MSPAATAIPQRPRGRPPKNNKAKLKVYKDKLALYNAYIKENGIPTGSATLKALPAAKAQDEIIYNEDKDKSDPQIVGEITQQFDYMNKVVKGACDGMIRAVIISGAGGTGKTVSVTEILDYSKKEKNIQSEMHSGIVTPVQLYMLLYRNSGPGNVVVLDDADTIFDDGNALSVLKAALDTSPTRKISWLANSNALKAAQVPNDFLYEGTMIFITNIDMQKIVDEGDNKLTPHVQALLTRCMYLDLKLHSPRQLQVWVDHVVRKRHIMQKAGCTADEMESALKYIKENRDSLRTLSIRTALQLAEIIGMTRDDGDWKAMANAVILKD